MKVNDAAEIQSSKLFSFYHKVLLRQLGVLICIKGPHLFVMSGCVCSGHYEKIKLGWEDSRQAKNGIRSLYTTWLTSQERVVLWE